MSALSGNFAGQITKKIERPDHGSDQPDDDEEGQEVREVFHALRSSEHHTARRYLPTNRECSPLLGSANIHRYQDIGGAVIAIGRRAILDLTPFRPTATRMKPTVVGTEP